MLRTNERVRHYRRDGVLLPLGNIQVGKMPSRHSISWYPNWYPTATVSYERIRTHTNNHLRKPVRTPATGLIRL